MPIDIALLHPNGEERGVGGCSIINEVIRWQLLRKQQQCYYCCASNTSSSFSVSDGKEGEEEEEEEMIKRFITNLQSKMSKRRALSAQLNSSRAKYNSLKKKKRSSVEDHRSMKQSSKEISYIQTNFEKISNEISCNLLPKLGNVVNTTPYSLYNDTAAAAATIKSGKTLEKEEQREEEEVMDPFYCIGAYEKISLGEGNEGNGAVLTGIGSELEYAIRFYALSFFAHPNKYCNIATFLDGQDKEVLEDKKGLGGGYYQSVHFPSPNLLDDEKDGIFTPELLHSIMGCSSSTSFNIDPAKVSNNGNHENNMDDINAIKNEMNEFSCNGCPICCYHQSSTLSSLSSSEEKENSKPLRKVIPPYALLSLLHQNQIYSESTLPKHFISISPQTLAYVPSSSTTTIPKYTHESNVIHLYAMTSNHLSASREKQDEMMHLIYSFYSSLLHHPSKRSRMLRIKMVPPDELEMNESRRLVVQGLLLSPSATKKKKKKTKGEDENYISLGYVSNYTDYVSRALHIKCGRKQKMGGGGSGGGGIVEENRQEYVHIIYSGLCNLHVLLDWLSCANVMFLRNPFLYRNGGPSEENKKNKNKKKQIDENDDTGGIGIPSTLASFLSSSIQTTQKQEEKQQQILFIPFIRRLIRSKKNGKTILKDLSSLNNMQVWLNINDIENNDNNEDEKNKQIQSDSKVVGVENYVQEEIDENCTNNGIKKDDTKNNHEENDNTQSEKSMLLSPPLPILGQNDITAEAMICPFGFLPFYYK